MTKKTLLRSAALGAVLTLGLSVAAHAADADKAVAHHKKHHAAAKAGAESQTAAEIAALKAEVAALEQRLDASNAASEQAKAAAEQAQASAQQAQAAAQNDQTAINQIPTEVTHAVAALPKPANDGWYFKGVKFTPGGYLAMESSYRSRGLMSDGATSPSFGSFPYEGASSKASHGGEWRASARQSRISGLVEANVTPDIKLTGYGEFDFLGAAQTANNNESNSFNLRIRHIYSTVDFKSYGLSVLAGQTWSLATLNDKGITPRNEVTPLNIDAQYNVGFVWARQPQIRVTENFGNGVWAAVSVENSQTNSIGGTAALLPEYGGVAFNQQCGALFNSVNNCSFNRMPDFVGKLAFDNPVAGHHLHVEGFGLYRDFYDRVADTKNGVTSYKNDYSNGWGAGFGVVAGVIPGRLDLQLSGLFGEGIGRYGTSQFSDVYEKSDGSLAGIKEHMLLAGLTFHATKALDVYGYFGEERADKSAYTANGAQGGYGNPLFSNLGGCESSSVLACNGNTKDTQEATIGLWDKAYSGDFGSFRLGLEYSYVKRESFDGVVGTANGQNLFGQVSGDDNMIYTSIRYYPFNK
jgi:hypothetical protein